MNHSLSSFDVFSHTYNISSGLIKKGTNQQQNPKIKLKGKIKSNWKFVCFKNDGLRGAQYEHEYFF